MEQESVAVPEERVLRLVIDVGGKALTCAFPSVWQTLALPVNTHAGAVGAASANGAIAIAAAPAAASSSGANEHPDSRCGRRAVEVMVISLSFSCDEQVRCELACGPSYVSVVAVARLCAQPAQCAIFSFCALCSDAMGALEFVGAPGGSGGKPLHCGLSRGVLSIPADVQSGRGRHRSSPVPAILPSPRWWLTKACRREVGSSRWRTTTCATWPWGQCQPETAATSRISKWGIRTGRSSSTTTADPAAGSRHACSRTPHRRTGCDSSASTGPAWDSPVRRRHAATPAGPTTW